MSSNLTKVKTLLPQLAPNELMQVRDLVSALCNTAVKRSKDGSATEESLEFLFYREFAEALLEESIKLPPQSLFKKSRTYPKYREAREAIEDFVENVTKPKKVTRIQRAKLYGLLMKIVVKFIKSKSIPLSAHTLALNLERGPQLLREDFPGYIESGLFMKLVEKL